MKPKILLSYLLVAWQVLLYAQDYNKSTTTANTHITFGSGVACEVSSDVCGMQTASKAEANASYSYLPKTQELVFTFSNQLDEENLKKLTQYPNEKEGYRYYFTQKYVLPNELVKSLQLSGKYYIPKGVYNVSYEKGNLVLRVKIIKE